MTKKLPLLFAVLAGSALQSPALAQTSPLQVSVAFNGTSTNVPQGGSANLASSGIGQSVTATVTIRNTGGEVVTLSTISLSGAPSISLVSTPALPLVLNPTTTAAFVVQYLPTASNSVTSQVVIGFSNNVFPSTYTFSINGNTSNLTYTYFILPSGAPTTLAPGAPIAFPATNLGSSSSAVVNVVNTGLADGAIQSINVTGADYQVAGLTLPTTVPAGQQVSFNVVFTPHAAVTSTGLLTIGTGTSNTIFPLTGIGANPDLQVFYRFADNNVHPLSDGASITFSPTDVNGSTTATIDIINQGTGTGTVTGITISGAGFQLNGVPPLPLGLPAAQDLRFSVIFAPTQSGNATGSLRITLGSTTITATLSGSTNAANVAVSYTLADGNVRTLSDGTLIAFPSIDINTTTTATIAIVNQGTAATTVNSVLVSGTGFTISGSPILPATIPAGQNLRFGIVFSPTQATTYSGTFSISLAGRTISGTLSGTTNPPNFAVSYALADGNTHPLINGGLISFPTIDINTTTTATITVLNNGTGTGQLTGISVTGTGFTITGSPILPTNIPAGQNVHFGIAFSPTQSGVFNGTFSITVGGQTISSTLTATTNVPTLGVSYTLADGVVRALTDGATVAFPSIDINATTTATITVLNQGSGTGTITNITLTGAGFQLSGAPTLPVSVPANQAVRFGIVFAPTKSGTFPGTFHIDLTGRSITATLTATTASPNFTLSYIDPDTSNIIPLQSGSTLPFDNTTVGSNTTITLLAANTGAGTGNINSIALGGTAPEFQLLSLPPLPLAVPPSQQLRFGIRFSPQKPQSSADTLSIDLNGQITTVNLKAQGIQSQFTYAVVAGDTTTPLSPGGTATIADTAVGKTASVVVTISNSGTGDGQIAAIAASGSGITLSNLPAVPFTLHPNASQNFTLTFAPTQPGPITGRLSIGNDTFTISANGIGPQLIFTYNSAGSAVPVADTGTVIFPPLSVGNTENLTFSIQNTGTSAATISSISLAAASTIFTASQLPALPMNLDPGATISFPIGFTPNNTGSLTATLRVNTASFTLSGNGTAPTALPSYQFQGPSGNLQPAQQPAIGITLASPYPLPLQGTLTLTFVSSVFTDDPSIQFASGGRTVKFTIPANSTQAVFSSNATSIPLQTGTTAGNIVITPSFAMQGGFDLTPASPTILTLTVPRTAPTLLNASITSETLAGFTVVVNGYSTTRGLTKLDVQITPKSGQKFSTTQLSIDVNSAASSWFQSAASQAFGGSFLVAIPFTLSNGSTTDDLVHLLQSLTITASNDAGASSAVTVQIP